MPEGRTMHREIAEAVNPGAGKKKNKKLGSKWAAMGEEDDGDERVTFWIQGNQDVTCT